jgi:hypothetical protein
MYILNIIKDFLEQNPDLNLNINIDRLNTNYTEFKFNNTNKIINIIIDYEHSLVISGGRGLSNDCKKGVIEIENTKDFYLVRINLDHTNYDIVINYSMPNIINITNSGLYPELSDKLVHVSPSLYKRVDNKEEKSIDILTSFINIHEPRRKKLLDHLSKTNYNHKNLTNCFDYNLLQHEYLKTKIMINIRQTDHHHTIEELRILPALQNKILVVCERGPLYEHLSYYRHIIFVEYHEILDKIKDILDNYQEYYDKYVNSFDPDNYINFYNYNYKNLSTKILSASNNLSNNIKNI